jgi:hypothetical protein
MTSELLFKADLNMDRLVVCLIWLQHAIHLFALQNIPALTAGDSTLSMRENHGTKETASN